MAKDEKKLSGFPDPFAKAKEKNSKEYGLQYAKALWATVNYNSWNSYDSRRKRIIEARNWAVGEPSIEHLKPIINTGGDTSYAAINWNLSNPIANIRNSYVNRTVGRDYDVVVDSIDKTSKGKLDEEIKKAKFKVQLKKYKKELQALGINPMVDDSSGDTPDSLKDVDLDFELNYKTEFEEFVETGINFVLRQNGEEQIKNLLAGDTFDIGTLGTRVGFDQNRDPYIRWVDWKNVISSPCKKQDFSDWQYFGEIIETPLAEVQMRSGNAFTDEQLFHIAQRCAGGSYGNRAWMFGEYYNSSFDFGKVKDFKIPIMDFVFKTVNKDTFMVKDNGKGGTYRPQKVEEDYTAPPYAKRKREVKSVDKEYLYSGQWIVDTEHIFDYGLMENMVRERTEGIYSSKVVCPFIMRGIHMYDMKTKSKLEEMIPLAEFMMLIDIKLQQLVGTTRPNGVAVDVWAMANLKSVSGAAGQEMDLSDAINLYNDLGSFFYASPREHGGYVNQKPIEALDNGLPASTGMMMEMYRNAQQRLYEISGFNPTVDGTSADKNALVGVEKLRIETHNNAMKHLTDAYTDVMGRSAHVIGLFLQDALEFHGKEKGYDMAIGFERSWGLKEMAKYNYAELGITISYRPTNDEIAYFERNLERDIQTQTINSAIATKARRISKNSIKSAEKYLERASEKFAEMQHKKSLELSQSNGEVQAVAAERAEAAKQVTLNLEWDRRDNHLQLEYQLKVGQSQQDHQEEMSKVVVLGDQKMEQLEAAAEMVESAEGSKGGNKDLSNTSIPKEAGIRQPKMPVSGLS